MMRSLTGDWTRDLPHSKPLDYSRLICVAIWRTCIHNLNCLVFKLYFLLCDLWFDTPGLMFIISNSPSYVLFNTCTCGRVTNNHARKYTLPRNWIVYNWLCTSHHTYDPLYIHKRMFNNNLCNLLSKHDSVST